MAKAFKSRASKAGYASLEQLVIPGFKSPFSRYSKPDNRWVVVFKSYQGMSW